tara:strand:- start:572 stop:2632 length:2061 start_codon:yes stop_codon:yes gene_type:complete
MSSKKKYNEQLKNEEEIEKKKIINIVIGTIASIIALIMLGIGVRRRNLILEKATYYVKKLLTFLRSIKWSEIFKALFNGTNRFTTGMSIFTMAFIGVLIFTIVNTIENPYDKANSPLWWVLGIVSIIPIIFFLIRIRNKKKFFNDKGVNSAKGQFFNILGVLKANSKTIATIISVILFIAIGAIISLSSDNAFVTAGMGFYGLVILAVMFAGYAFIINSNFFEKYIKNNQFLQLLFNLIFIIPCIIALAFNWVSEQVKNTPSFVYVILLLEVVILALYFIIPSVDRTFYFSLSNKKSNSKDLQEIMRLNKEKKKDLQKQVFELKQTLFKKSRLQNVKYMNTQGVNDTWNELFKSYSDYEENDIVQGRLIDLGFCQEGEDENDSNCLDVLNKHVEYIRDTQQNINLLEQQIKTIKTELSPAEKLMDTTNSNLQGDEIYNMKEIRDAVVLQMNPVSLKKITTPSSAEEINLFTNIAGQPNYSYGLSFWIFIHPQSGNIKNCNNIINFDNRPQVFYCPTYKKIPINSIVTYKNNGKKGVIKKSKILTNNNIYYDISGIDVPDKTNVSHKNITYKYPYSVLKFALGGNYETTQKEFTLPNLKMQKWNNIVVNFIDGTYDIFVNGEMVNSFQGDMEEFNYSNIKIGEDNGVSGGIANVVYYKNYLTKNKILSNYNLLKNKSPPIVSDLLKV